MGNGDECYASLLRQYRAVAFTLTAGAWAPASKNTLFLRLWDTSNGNYPKHTTNHTMQHRTMQV